jgi:thiol-disulfide isomerase/thioredoxin
MKKIKLLFALPLLIYSCSESEPNFYKNLSTNEIYTTAEYGKFFVDIRLKTSDSIIRSQGLTNPGEIKKTRDSLLKEIQVTSKLEKIIKNGDSIIRPFKYDLRVGKEYLVRSDNFEKIGLEIAKKEYETLEGNKIFIGGKQDKPTLISLWFIGCRGCIEEMPALNLLKSKYADNVDFVALTFDKKEDVLKFLDRKGFDFIHLTNKEEFIQEIATKPYPENIFIDKNGVIKYIEGGIGNDLNLVIDHFGKILEKLINE